MVSTTFPRLRALLKQKDFDQALTLATQLRQRVQMRPDLLLLTATIHRQKNDLENAIATLNEAHQQFPDNRQILIHHISDLLQMGKLEQALLMFEKLKVNELHSAEDRVIAAQLYYETCEYEFARDQLVEALKIAPNLALAHLELAYTLLMLGDWSAGWREYEWRYKVAEATGRLPRLKIPEWTAMHNTGHLLLIADQGFGDCIQFSRYIPLAAERCKQITLIRSKPLGNLLDSVPGVTQGITNWKDVPPVNFHTTLSSLPGLFGTTTETIPTCTNLIRPNADKVRHWNDLFSKTTPDARLKIGIAWSGRQDYKMNRTRSYAVELIKPLLEIPHTGFYSLQIGDLAHQAGRIGLYDLTEQMIDFTDQAAAMQALDLIITPDTSVAHLAGTLGIPCWVLLAHAPDWRWGSSGTDSIWYPGLQLIRQDHTRSWESVFATVKRMLDTLVKVDEPLAALAAVRFAEPVA